VEIDTQERHRRLRGGKISEPETASFKRLSGMAGASPTPTKMMRLPAAIR
jgi:hypothetical protein